MRLIRSVKKLERAAAARAEKLKGKAWGLVWSESEVLLGRELEPGESLAVDVYTVEELDGASIAKTRERATSDVKDLGNVYGTDGALIGRVDSASAPDGRLLTIHAVNPPAAARPAVS